MSARSRTYEPADHVSGAAEPAAWPLTKPIEATVGSVPNGEAARFGSSHACSGIRPTPEAKPVKLGTSDAALGDAPEAMSYSPRSTESAGQRWPVP